MHATGSGSPYAGNFISMYAMGARFNVAWDRYSITATRMGLWRAGVTYGRSWLLSSNWNMEVEAGIE